MAKKPTERQQRWRRNSGKRRVEIYLDPPLYQALSAKARAIEAPLAEWIRELLARAVRSPGHPAVDAPPVLPASLFETGAAKARVSALVAYARRLQEEGLTQARIAERWTAEGIPTLRWAARGWTWRNVANLLARHGKGS